MNKNNSTVATYPSNTVAEKDSILRYETALKTGKFVLIIHGSMDDAKDILDRTQAEAVEHDR